MLRSIHVYTGMYIYLYAKAAPPMFSYIVYYTVCVLVYYTVCVLVVAQSIIPGQSKTG